MQVTEPFSQQSFPRSSWLNRLGWFLAGPLLTFVVVGLVLAFGVAGYEDQHANRFFSGVMVGNLNLGGLTRPEAEAALNQIFPYPNNQAILFVDPATGREWPYTPAELGIQLNISQTLDTAYQIGRQGLLGDRLQQQFKIWYYGQQIAPIIIFDEGKVDAVLGQIATDVNRPAEDAHIVFDGTTLVYQPAVPGRELDRADTRGRLLQTLTHFQTARIELLIHDLAPTVQDPPEVAAQIQQMINTPITLYFQQPLADLDLQSVEITTEQLANWLRIELLDNGDGTSQYHLFMDENGIRNWLNTLAGQIYKAPQNARFYFDDYTRELVLVEPHIPGRELNIDATVAQISQQAKTPNRSVPFIVQEIVPQVHAAATAQELGITQLITATTTYFYGSPPERKHNIARAAAQFFGIVIAPGEEFSFNRYLGDVTEEAGFTNGLVIIGGRTIEGVGGGVCQVSTTIFQAAFWSGFPIRERLEHGYQVHYYDDGEGAGMDATVFDPYVDFRFVNNTPYHLLIENYYNETYESLTFKFYSTSMGRTVVKSGPFVENVVPPNPDVWEYNPNLASGEIKQVDWAVEGAKVTVVREVYNKNGELMYGTEYFISNYIPWQNIYQYGPDVEEFIPPPNP